MSAELIADILMLLLFAGAVLFGTRLTIARLPNQSPLSADRPSNRQKKRAMRIPSDADEGKVEPTGTESVPWGKYPGMTIARRQQFPSDHQVSRSDLKELLSDPDGVWTRIGDLRRDTSFQSDDKTTDTPS